MSRPYHVYDYEGEHLGSFATWDLAHEWAHLQAVLNGVPTPLEVQDRATTGRRRVWADHCEPVREATAEIAGQVAGPDDQPVDEFIGDALRGGRCSAVTAAAFAPPRPRQPSELTEADLSEV